MKKIADTYKNNHHKKGAHALVHGTISSHTKNDECIININKTVGNGNLEGI